MPEVTRPGGNFPSHLSDAGRQAIKEYKAEQRRLRELRRLRDAEEKAQERGDSLRQFGGEGKDNLEQWGSSWNTPNPVPRWRVPFTDDWYQSMEQGATNPYDEQGSWTKDATRNWEKRHTFLHPWEWRDLGLDPKAYPGHVFEPEYGPGTGEAPKPAPRTPNPDQVPRDPNQTPDGWRPAAATTKDSATAAAAIAAQVFRKMKAARPRMTGAQEF